MVLPKRHSGAVRGSAPAVIMLCCQGFIPIQRVPKQEGVFFVTWTPCWFLHGFLCRPKWRWTCQWHFELRWKGWAGHVHWKSRGEINWWLYSQRGWTSEFARMQAEPYLALNIFLTYPKTRPLRTPHAESAYHMTSLSLEIFSASSVAQFVCRSYWAQSQSWGQEFVYLSYYAWCCAQLKGVLGRLFAVMTDLLWPKLRMKSTQIDTWIFHLRI